MYQYFTEHEMRKAVILLEKLRTRCIAGDEYLSESEDCEEAKVFIKKMQMTFGKDHVERGKDAIAFISSALEEFVNGSCGSDAEKLAVTIRRSWHPTLQQMLFGLFTRCITLWAADEGYGYIDGRLEYTHEVCKEIVNGPLRDRGVGAPLI